MFAPSTLESAVKFADQGQPALFFSRDLASVSAALETIFTTVKADPKYGDQAFFLRYQAGIDSQQKLTEAFVVAAGLTEQWEQQPLDRRSFSLFFPLLLERYVSPFFVIEGLDKLLFYGGEVHMRVHVAEYQQALSAQADLTPFQSVYWGFPNVCLRGHATQTKDIRLIGGATKGTMEFDYVFRNSKSPIWANLAEYCDEK